MNWDAIGALGEVSGAAAVVISVIYLAVQVRKQTEEAKLSATRELSTQFQVGLDMIAQDGELTDIWEAGTRDFEALPSNHRLRLSIYLQRMTRVLEAQYIHSKNENVSPELFQSTQLAFKAFLTFPGSRTWWQVSKQMYVSDFGEHVDKMIAEILKEEQSKKVMVQQRIGHPTKLWSPTLDRPFLRYRSGRRHQARPIATLGCAKRWSLSSI